MAYISVRPDHGARLGHAFSEWNSARIISRRYGFSFLNTGLGIGCSEWDSFLGIMFCHDYTTDSSALSSVSEHIISQMVGPEELQSYATYEYRESKSLVISLDFFLGNNLFEFDQTQLLEEISRCYETARLICPVYTDLDQGFFNVGIHVRKGDVSSDNNRQCNIEYYRRAIAVAAKTAVNQPKELAITLFTDGTLEEIASIVEIAYEHSNSLHLRSRQSPMIDLHSMISSNLLICSKSGFGYLAHLLRPEGITTIAPAGFWHPWRNGVKVVDDEDMPSLPSADLQVLNHMITPSDIELDHSQPISNIDLPLSMRVLPSLLRNSNCPNPAFSEFIVPRMILETADRLMLECGYIGIADRQTFYSSSKARLLRLPTVCTRSNSHFLFVGGYRNSGEDAFGATEISIPSLLVNIRHSDYSCPSEDFFENLLVAILILIFNWKAVTARTLFIPSKFAIELMQVSSIYEKLESHGIEICQVDTPHVFSNSIVVDMVRHESRRFDLPAKIQAHSL